MRTKTGTLAIVWFEGENTYTLADSRGKTVFLSEEEAINDGIKILRSEGEVDQAEEDIRYAISTDLMTDLFGWHK